MKLFFLCLAACTYANLFGQVRTENFELKTTQNKISNSLYNFIEIIDIRDDTTNLGIVQKGAFNKKAKVVPEVALAVQLNNVLKEITDSTAAEKKLVMLIKQLSFVEVTTMSERGYYYFKADLYSKTGNEYAMLDKIDTVVVVKSLDVTKALLRNGGKTIVSFVAGNLLTAPVNNDLYSFYQLGRMDSIEKSHLPLYTADTLAEGVYDTYEAFKNQKPDHYLFKAKEKKNKITEVSILNDKQKYVPVSIFNIYAVVYKKQAYIVTDYGYYPLVKKDQDFYFSGKYKKSADPGSVAMAGFFFGILGSAIAAEAGSTGNGEIKIDYSTGSFMMPKAVNKK